jgi:hypothetical protein
MSIVVFLFALILLIGGAAAGYMSLDLLPTGLGVLYAMGGAVGVVGAAIVFALGVLIRRIDALTRATKQAALVAAAASALELEPYAEFGEAAPAVEAVDPAPVDAVEAPPVEATEPPAEIAAEEAAPPQEASAAEAEAESEDPVNENRAGHLPTLGEIERAIETPEAPPALIGRYSSGGANYMIFSDGSIEAETSEGAFKFASMGDFKRYLMERNEGQGA